MSADKWYHRGRESRANGEPFPAVPDQRLSMESREAFLRGYNDECRQRVNATPEQREEARRTVAKLKEWAKETLGGQA